MTWGVTGSFDDNESEYRVEERFGCKIVWGSIPLNEMVNLTKDEPEDVLLSVDLSSKIGATFVFGTKENLDKMANDPELPICPKRLQEAENARKKGLPEAFVKWLTHGDRGNSSNAIAQRVTGVISGEKLAHHPLDTSDFGRCLGVVNTLISDDLSEIDIVKEMIGISDTWTRLVWEWFKLRKLYESGDSEGVYSLLKEIQAGIKA